MRVVIQKVSSACVSVDSNVVGKIDHGLLILLGITHEDTLEHAQSLAQKVVNLRIFPDSDGKMNCSVQDVDGEILVVSQFTLYGNAAKGKRPSFIQAARPEKARPLYEAFVEEIRSLVGACEMGEFGAHMDVALVNDGPVTILLEQ